MASDYLTLDELKAASEVTGVSFMDYDGQRNITAACRAIEEYTGRRFWKDTDTTSVRFYSPLDSAALPVDDIVSLGTVQVDLDGDGTFETTWTENTDFVLCPLNAAADSKPYETIEVRRASFNYFPCFERSVQVTAQFGWPDVPEQVKTATTLLATKLVKRVREAPFGVVGLGIDNVAVRVIRSDPEMMLLLDPLCRGQGVMVA